MKCFTYSIRLFLAVACLMSVALGCKKKEDEFVRIQTIVPQNIIDDLRAKGMEINEGIKPPTLNNAYEVSPYTLQTPYGEKDPWKKNYVINDYRYKFYGQTNKNEITYDYYNTTKIDEGTGAGAFIAGDGQKFTIFSEEIGKYKSTDYTNVTLISGELTSAGIKNFQYAFIIKSKSGLEADELIDVNLGRVWTDGDAISKPISNFRTAGQTGDIRIATPAAAAGAR